MIYGVAVGVGDDDHNLLAGNGSCPRFVQHGSVERNPRAIGREQDCVGAVERIAQHEASSV
jgi:hypothetical protein